MRPQPAQNKVLILIFVTSSPTEFSARKFPFPFFWEDKIFNPFATIFTSEICCGPAYDNIFYGGRTEEKKFFRLNLSKSVLLMENFITGLFPGYANNLIKKKQKQCTYFGAREFYDGHHGDDDDKVALK